MGDEYNAGTDAYEKTPLKRIGELLFDYEHTLPELCYSASTESNEIIILKRGETGYYKTDWDPVKDYDTAIAIAKRKNDRMGITPEQYDAMVFGSMLGFGEPEETPEEQSAVQDEQEGDMKLS
ncbi:MAG: hypothetical protein LBN36_04570 [Clostridiales Family XIII bacterium]|jgi:hypothetical protein|nr:hypothetical protein [Clostridiales Family XIII bacterium]